MAALFSTKHEPLDLRHPADDLLNLGASYYLSRPEEAQHHRQLNHVDPIGLAIPHGAAVVRQQREVALLTECNGLTLTHTQLPGQCCGQGMLYLSQLQNRNLTRCDHGGQHLKINTPALNRNSQFVTNGWRNTHG